MNTNNPPSSSGAAASADSSAPRRNSKRPKYSKFTQQELPACKPILTPGWVISSFLLVTVVFIPIGLASLSASNRVTKNMKKPIYVYYQLDNFYQNHRRYVKSRSDKQLKYPESADNTETCKPENVANSKPIVPCGLIAWSLFNDTYSFSLTRKDSTDRNITVNKKGIAWKSDRDHKFGKKVFPSNFQDSGLIGGKSLDTNLSLSEQEDLIVWMRTAALPTFRKLYGKIEIDLNKGDKIEVTLDNNYNTYSFSGKKKLVLSTTTWIGGKNDFLGIAYLTVGGLCLALAIGFSIVYLVKPRRLGDPSYLSWNRNAGGH